MGWMSVDAVVLGGGESRLRKKWIYGWMIMMMMMYRAGPRDTQSDRWSGWPGGELIGSGST